jgi:phage-related minor tail protein
MDKKATKGGANKQGGGREAVGGSNRAVTDQFDAGKTGGVFGDASTKITPKPDIGKGAGKSAKDYANALRDVKKAVIEVTAAFKESSKARLEDLDFQFKSLGMSQDQVALESQRRDILKEQNTALADLAAKQVEINESEDLSKKGKAEALALIAQQIVAVNALAATELATSDAKLQAIQAENLKIDEQLKKTELLQQANSNRAVLQNLEDQLSLVGLYGDKLDEVTAQIELQQKLREIELEFQNQLLALEDKKLDLGKQRYAMELAMLQQGKAQAIGAANAVAAAEKKVDDARKKSERNDIGAALGKRFEELERSVDPAVTAVEGLNSVFSNMGNALDTFVETGKFKFGDFAKSIILDLTKIAAKAAATKLFSMIGKSIVTALGKKAAGGPVMANKPYVVGEQGPELFVPNSAGSIMTNASMNKNADGGSGMGATVNNTYITNNISAIDSRSVAQMFVENRKSLLGASMMARKETPYGG